MPRSQLAPGGRAVALLLAMCAGVTCVIPERMADYRLQKLKLKFLNVDTWLKLLSVTEQGNVGIAHLQVYHGRKQHRTHNVYNTYEGSTNQYYQGHKEGEDSYWNVKDTQLGGMNSNGGKFDVQFKIHQNVRSDFIAIIDITDYKFQWWWEKHWINRTAGIYRNVNRTYTSYGRRLNATTEQITLDRPYTPLNLEEALVKKVTYVKKFDWASDKIQAVVDVKLKWINQLNDHFPNEYEKLTNNMIMLERRPMHQEDFSEWEEVERPPPENYLLKNGYNYLFNEKLTSVTLYNPSEMHFRVQAVNLMGTSVPSVIAAIEKPPPPRDLLVAKIVLNSNEYRRDFSLQWVNRRVHANGGIDDIQIYKNLIQYRIKDHAIEEMWGEWRDADPYQVQVNMVEKVDHLLNYHTFEYIYPAEMQFRVKAVNIFGISDESNTETVVRPHRPTKLKCVGITISKSNPKLRNIEMEWENPPPDGANRVIRNWFERRDKYPLGGPWYAVKPPSINVGIHLDDHKYMLVRRVNLTNQSPVQGQYRVKAENFVGFSEFSDTVTIPKPLPATNLTLLSVDLSEKKSARDLKFKFVNPNYNRTNKMYGVKFQHRIALDNYSTELYDVDYGPWINSTTVEVPERDILNPEVTLKDFSSGDMLHPAIQFRIILIGLVDEAPSASNIVTIVRPSYIHLNLRQVFLHASERGNMPEREFLFDVTSPHVDKFNKLIKLHFEHRISRYMDGSPPGPWVPADVDVEEKELGIAWLNKTLRITFQKYNYLEVQFRVHGTGFFGPSYMSNTVIAVVPTEPREFNYIYYGSDVDCSSSCELELDWRTPESNGTFEIYGYLIQYKKRMFIKPILEWRSFFANWWDNCTVPETSWPYKRQFITFNNAYQYQILALNILGRSMPSQLRWYDPFVPYHLKVDYHRDPANSSLVVVDLEWDKIKDKKISHYIVQSNLFFEHDERAMRDHAVLSYRHERRVQFRISIEFLPYTALDGSERQYFLPEFRVITRYVNRSLYGPASCTTLFHFSREEYDERGLALRGGMP